MAELTEEAANSQDAGTLQYLKTLDSIESKLNQLQVAFQEFYTSMGLENVFKGALDMLTGFITQLNSLPKLFDTIPVAAIGMATNLILAIKNILSMVGILFYQEFQKIKNAITEVTGTKHEIKLSVNKEEFKKEVKEAVREGMAAGQQEADNNRIDVSEGEGGKTRKQLREEGYFDKNEKHFWDTGVAKIVGNLVKLAGAAASTIALTKQNTAASMQSTGIEASKVWSGGLGLAGNVVGGFISGGWVGAVIGLAQSLPNIITLFDGLTVTSKELVAQLDTEIQKQKEQVILRRNEVSNLEAAAKKLEELREHQYDSVEANQEYIDYMNQLGDSHSELISSLDAEGNSVIELKDVYQQLISTRAKLSEEELKQRKLELERATITQQSLGEAFVLTPEKITNYLDNAESWLGMRWDTSRAYDMLGLSPKYSNRTTQLAALDLNNLLSANPNIVDTDVYGPALAAIVTQIGDSGVWEDIFKGTNISWDSVWDKINGGKIDSTLFSELQQYARIAKDYYDHQSVLQEELTEINKALGSTNYLVSTWASKQQPLSELAAKNLSAFQTSSIVNLIAQQIEGLEDLDLATETGLAQATELLAPLLEEYRKKGSKWEENYTNYYNNMFMHTDEELNEFLNQLYESGDSFDRRQYEVYVNKFEQSIEDFDTNYQERLAAFADQYAQQLGIDDLKDNIDFLPIKNFARDQWDALITQLYDGVGEYVEQGLYVQARQYYDNYITLLATLNAKSADTATSNAILNLIKSADLTDYDSLTQLISSLETYDQSNEDIDLTDIIQQLTQVKQSLAYNVNTIKEDYLAALSTLVKSADDLAKDVSKGLDYSDLAGALSKIHTLDAGKNLELTDIVQYSQEAGAYIYTTQGFLLAQQQVMEQIQQETQDETARIEARQAQLQSIQFVDLAQFWGSTDANWTQEQLTAATSSINDEATRSLVQQAIQAGVKDLQSFQTWFATELQNNEELLKWLPAQEKLALEQYFSNLSSSLMSAIDWNKLVQGIDTDFSIQQLENIFATISPDEDVHALAVEFANNIARTGTVAVEAYKDLIEKIGAQFDYSTAKTLFEGQFAQAANTISDLFNTQIGGAVSEEVNALLVAANVSGFDTHKLGVINSFEEMIAAAEAVYAAMTTTNSTLAERNYTYAAILEGKQLQTDQALGIIESSVDLSYDNLADFAILMGENLEVLMSSAYDYIEKVNGKYRLTDSGLQALLEDQSLEGAEFEFASAIKSRNDTLIEADKKITSGIVDEVNALVNAKVGEKLNLTYIQNAFGDFGGQLVNGILTITEDTNILQLAADIRAHMEASGQFLQSDIVALGEALDNLLKSYASLISGGIQGSLSQTDAANLKGFASGLGVDLDFTRTKNGLKISTDQAGKLYQELKKVDSITAQLVFDDLVESLSEAGSGFENISQTMARIAEIQHQIAEAQGDTSGLQEQLALYQEIARAQSDNPDSFSFMDNSIPVGMQGPENYWNAVGTAFKVMNQAGQSGYMEIQDFYNITQEMKNLAIMSGNDLQFMGQTIYADGSGAAELIQMAMSALSNIDGEGVKVDFSKLGQSFSGGAADMASGFDDAVKTMAKSQIEMLDAEIAMLEAIVAMEELGDVDVDQSGTLELGEIFKINDDGNYLGFTENFTEAKEAILERIEASEELQPLLRDLTVNGHTLEEILKTDFDYLDDLGFSYEQYASIWNGLYKAMASGDYDLESVMSSVADVLAGSDNRYVYNGKDGKKTIVIDSSGMYEIEWDSKTTTKNIAEAFNKEAEEVTQADREEIQALLEQWSAGELTETADLIKLKVAIGQIDVEYDDNNQPVGYKVGKEPFESADAALSYLALKDAGVSTKEGYTVNTETGQVTVIETHGGLEVQVTAAADGTTQWTMTGVDGTYSSQDELYHALFDQQYADTGITYEQMLITCHLSGTAKMEVNAEVFGQADSELKSQLAEKLSSGDWTGAEQVALDMGVAIQLTADNGTFNVDALQQLKDLIGIEDKTINLTVNMSEGTDPVLAELLNAGETPIPRTMEVDVSATGEFTTDFVDSLNNLNAENLEIVVTKLAALSSSTRNIQNADFSNIEGLSTQWEEVLAIVQEVSDLVASLTEKTFTVNVETAGMTAPTVNTSTSTSGQTTSSVGGGSTISADAAPIALPGPDIKEWTDAATTVSDASVTAASGLTNVATPLEKMPDVSGRIDSLVSAMQKIPTYAASRVAALASSMAAIQSKAVTLRANLALSVTATGTTGIEGTGTKNLSFTVNSKGNVAFAGGSKRTLVGELGPELVVSRGHYYVVGQNGAEFVDLDKDAIVFNHIQTKKLLGSGRAGRGTAITNERNAVSWATGNTSGPAMASASEALALLKQIRAMWQSMLGASLKDLGGLAGRGGGGGGGGGGNTKYSPQIGTFERWYNLMRQIADLEQKITLEEAKRKNMRNGADYSRSLQKELTMLQTQLADQKELNFLQQDYLKHEIADFNKTQFTKIFTFTQDGFMQFVDGSGRGLDVLSKLTATDENGRYIRKLDDTAVNQLKYLESVGFDYSAFTTDQETGNKLNPATEEDAAKIVETFWDRLQYYLDNIDGLRDTIADGLVQEQELLEKISEIQQEYVDNQLKLEQSLVKAIEDRQQAVIDALTDEKEAIQDAAKDYIDGLSDALQRERDMYQKNQTQQETTQLQRQLAILQRSGGSAADIKNLQDQISGRLQDRYFDAQQEQIDAVQAASDREIERLDTQIELMTDALEYQKENGLLWAEVSNMLATWSPEQMLQFVQQYTKEWQSISALDQEEHGNTILKEAQMHVQNRDSEAGWAVYETMLTRSNVTAAQGYNMEAIKSAYKSGYQSGGINGADAAAQAEISSQKVALSRMSRIASNQAAGAYDIDTTQLSGEEDIDSQRVAFGSGNTVAINTIGGATVPLMRQPNVSMKDESQMVSKGTSAFRATAFWNDEDNVRWIEGKFADAKGNEIRGWFNANAMKNVIDAASLDALRKQLKAFGAKTVGFSAGGLDDFTGLAMLHGTKQKPEAVLNAEQTAFLREDLLSNSRNSLMSIVQELQSLYSNVRTNTLATADTGDTYSFENVTLNFEAGTISNDYSARRAGEQVWDELLSMARKSGNVRVSRR